MSTFRTWVAFIALGLSFCPPFGGKGPSVRARFGAMLEFLRWREFLLGLVLKRGSAGDFCSWSRGG